MKILEKIAKKRIRQIINKWDPEEFLLLGAPVDEYTPEVNMIYYGLKNHVEDTVYYTFRILLEAEVDEGNSFEGNNDFSKDIHFPDYTNYDIFECREIEAAIKKNLWWMK